MSQTDQKTLRAAAAPTPHSQRIAGMTDGFLSQLATLN